eukprot:s1874_g19.t1
MPRKSDVRSYLETLCSQQGVTLRMTEVDLQRSDDHDMANEDKWNELVEKIKAGLFYLILMSPPCSTWSRAVWANKLGPRPVRSREYPLGFPWLVGELRDKAALGTLPVMRCIEVLEVAPPLTICLWEHPEDLGRARNGTPASVEDAPRSHGRPEDEKKSGEKGQKKPIQDPAVDFAASNGSAPRYCMRGEGSKIFDDGAGLCSEGNKRPAFRRESAMRGVGERILGLTTEEEMRKDLYKLALGHCKAPPFRQELIKEAREIWLSTLVESTGVDVQSLQKVEKRQPFMLAAIAEHLKVIEDPDADAFSLQPGSFRSGVPIGVDGLPRVPAVFEAKEKWRKYDPVVHPGDKENYVSAKKNALAVQLQFRKEEALGAMVELEETEARERYGDKMKVAALAALKKSDHSFR